MWSDLTLGWLRGWLKPRVGQRVQGLSGGQRS